MVNFIVVGKCKRITSAVLQAMRSFTDAKCVMIGGPATASLRWSALCKRHIMMDLDGSDDDAFADTVNAIARRSPHLVLIPADCDAIRLANRVRERLTIRTTPIPKQATLDMLDNKWRFHEFCRQHDLAVPHTRLLQSKHELNYDETASEFGVPFVVKPIDQAGSTGVRIIRSKAEFNRAILRNGDYDYGKLIVQRYIDGEDIDISVLSLGGRLCAFAIQQTEQSRIVFRADDELHAMAAELCRASAYHGIMHIDARRETATGRMYLIESNPRFWASLTASVWCGLNFVAESIVMGPASTAVRQLTAGTAYTRHPLIRPASWRPMITDHGARGRLLRAMTFDPPALGEFAKALPLNSWRSASRRIGAHFRALRHPDADGKRAENPA